MTVPHKVISPRLSGDAQVTFPHAPPAAAVVAFAHERRELFRGVLADRVEHSGRITVAEVSTSAAGTG